VRVVVLNDHAVRVSTGSGAADEFLRRFAWWRGHADIWRVFDDSEAFAAVVDGLIGPWRGKNITKVCAGVVVGMAVLVDELDDEIRDGLPPLTSTLSAGDLPSDQR
jgi:hypothetical protein